MSIPAKDKKPYHHGDLRDALLREATAAIREHGPSAITLRAIARRAGVSHAAPYRHFKNKEGLIAAVSAQGFAQLTQVLLQAQAPFENPLTRFERLSRAYVQFAVANTEIFRLMFSSELADKDAHPELAEAARAAFDLVTTTVAACQAIGLVRQGDPADLSIAGWSMTHGLAVLLADQQILATSGEELDALVQQASATLYIGMRPLE